MNRYSKNVIAKNRVMFGQPAPLRLETHWACPVPFSLFGPHGQCTHKNKTTCEVKIKATMKELWNLLMLFLSKLFPFLNLGGSPTPQTTHPTSSPTIPPTIVDPVSELVSAFRILQDVIVWPVPQSDRGMISSTFGPRLANSGTRYDFHRGIDIHGEVGEPVLASYDGVVTAVDYFSNGGNYVTLEHEFNPSIEFMGNTLSKWYSMYLHLNAQLVLEGDTVKAGEQIGEVGETGSTTSPHLHHELRIGTRCSLEFALGHPESTCNTYGFDPHVHPILLYPNASFNAPSLLVLQDASVAVDGIFLISTSDTAPDLNRYEIYLDGSAEPAHTLDLTTRQGYDMSSTAIMDIKDTTVPHLDPVGFGYPANSWTMRLVVPNSWIPDTTSSIGLSVTTIWGESTSSQLLVNPN